MPSFLRLERKQKNASNAFRNRLFPLCSYSSGIETINTFIRTRSSLENRTRFQTKMSKVYTRFQTKHPYPIGRHVTYMAYIGEYPPPPPPGTKIERDLTTFSRFSSQLLSGLRANSWLKEWSAARKGRSQNSPPPTSPQIPEIFFANRPTAKHRDGFTQTGFYHN